MDEVVGDRCSVNAGVKGDILVSANMF